MVLYLKVDHWWIQRVIFIKCNIDKVKGIDVLVNVGKLGECKGQSQSGDYDN